MLISVGKGWKFGRIVRLFHYYGKSVFYDLIFSLFEGRMESAQLPHYNEAAERINQSVTPTTTAWPRR